jgi:pectate lyase
MQECLTDCISIRSSRDIWINHVELYRGGDGLIDVTKTSTRVTVSNCHFHDHHKAMLLGASDKNVKVKESRLLVFSSRFSASLLASSSSRLLVSLICFDVLRGWK